MKSINIKKFNNLICITLCTGILCGSSIGSYAACVDKSNLVIEENINDGTEILYDEEGNPIIQELPIEELEEFSEEIVDEPVIPTQTVEELFASSVFVGDSLVVGYSKYSEKHSDYCTHNSSFIAKRGFAAYYAIHPDKFESKQPTLQKGATTIWDSIALMDNIQNVFIYLGTNDLIGFSPEASSNFTITLANNILAANPDVKIYILGIAPTYAGINKGYLNNTNIEIYNNLLKEKAGANGYLFMNMADSLQDQSKNIKAEFSLDQFVHQNSSAYAVWNQVLYDFGNSIVSGEATISSTDSYF